MNVMTISQSEVNVGEQAKIFGIFFNHWRFKIFFRFLLLNKGRPSGLIFDNSFLKLP